MLKFPSPLLRLFSFIIAILFGMPGLMLAQKQNNIWYFGDKAGLDFNTIPPKPLESGLFTLEGTASISDPAGHLLFYTNGATVWDSKHNVMPDGNGLMGGSSSTQAALIVPLPNSCSQYYLFATEDHLENGGLTYSIVDMCLNNGLGDIVSSSKNTLVIDQTAEKITAVLHSNGVDIWIVTHTLGSDDFLAYLLSPAGLNTTPVISSIGSLYPANGHIGPAKASHDGSKIVSSSSFHDICEMFDFNSTTGELSNFYDINQLFNGQRWVYGIEFSPNDQLLYLSTFFVTNYLYQIDIETKLLTKLNSVSGNYHYGALQMGPDRKIYMARNNSSFLDVIHKPDLPGKACQYEEGGQILADGTVSQLGLPNFVPYSFFPSINTVVSLGNDTTLCMGDPFALEVTIPSICETASILWNDGSTGSELVVNQPGLYWVEVQNSCTSFRDSIQIDIIVCQPVCSNGAFAQTLGSSDKNERGYSIAVSESENILYVGGIKNDSVVIVKVNAEGAIQWTRTFDIVPGAGDHINGMFVDSEGKLGIAGTAGDILNGGTVFVFRYDPIDDIVLWSNRLISTSPNFCLGIIEKGPGGNYLLSNNPSAPNNAELIELNRESGVIIENFSKHYDLGSAESLYDLVLHEGWLYASARFTDGNANAGMRNTLLKLDPEDGAIQWIKLGHRGNTSSARLYSTDLVIEQNQIYSISFGDPDGISLDFTELFIQKTNLKGDVAWIKQYELPGTNDWVDEIIASDNGFVVLARNRSAPSDIILFKINDSGDVLWAKKFDFSKNDNSLLLGGITSQLVELNDHIFFTAYTEAAGFTDMIFVKTNLQGEINDTCGVVSPIEIAVKTVKNPVYYEVEPTVFTFIPEQIQLQVTPDSSFFPISQNCSERIFIENIIEATICVGESFEGHTQSGIYSDTFDLTTGCDSIRILHLTVNACQPECGMSFGPAYGSPEINEKGYCLTATPEGDGTYVSGIKEDSILILKVGLKGAVLWSRTFDLVPDSEEYPYSIIVDSEGMLALAGTTDDLAVGGPVFAMRYDPYNHQVLWSNEYISVPNSVTGGIIQKGNGGNYLLVNDLNDYDSNHIDVELLELNINTGAVVPTGSKKYRLSNRESLFEIVYDGQFIYGTGRYKADNSNFNFRNTLVKLNPDDGTQVWVKMGHLPNNVTARLYGGHLLIDQNAIISGSYGDPSGTSVTTTNLYLQKTDLDGNVIWLKQYNISETNSFCYGIIKSGNGYVVLSGRQLPNTDLVMFKIDQDGNVLWARKYNFSSIVDQANINATLGARGQTKVIQVGNQLIFTAFGINTSGKTDILVVRTDLEGNVDNPCVQSQNFLLTVEEINNPFFFDVFPAEDSANPEVNESSPESNETLISPREECTVPDTIFTSIEATICAGETFEGYSATGVYIDEFFTPDGCDSIRTLHLTVNPLISFLLIEEICSGSSFEGYTQSGIFADTFNTINGCDSIRTLRLSVISCEAIVHYDLDACRSYMEDGSHMDYTEFTPAYPNVLSCADVSADFLFREFPQKHSCTPGIEGTPAMCVTTLNSCTYLPGNEASIVIEVTIDPSVDSVFRLTGLEFYEKSPATFNWIDGNNGPNNYPRFYGLRILKNGVEIFRQTNIQTTTNWTLQSFDFIDHDSFRIEETTVFRIELLPYCPVGNGALVSAWDVDEVKIYGGCIPVQDKKPMIFGHVHTKTGKEMSNIQMILSDNPSFVSTQVNNTDDTGQYVFEDLFINQSYYLKGYKNDDVLNGVSTLDLIHIQKHLLGKELFTSLHQYVAADVNRSGHVSVIDLLDLRKLLLGMYSAFPRNTSWRFGPLPQDFSGVDPDSFEETKNITSLMNDTNTVDFVGIKVGDLNDDVELDANAPKIISRNSEAMTLHMEDMLIKAGVPFSVDIKAGDYLMMAGIQFSMQLKNIGIIEVKRGTIPVTHQHFSLSDDGLFRLSWSADDAVNVSIDDVIFTITMTSDEAGLLSDKIEILKNGLKAEAYAAVDLEILPLEFEFQTKRQKTAEIGFLRIEPNPVHDNATIRFNLVNSGQAVIRFYDASGKLLFSTDMLYSAGEHLEQFSINQFHSGKGIIYCQLISNGYTDVQKFVNMN